MVIKDNIDSKQTEILQKLEKLMGKKIPLLKEIQYESFGFQTDGENVIGLGLAKLNLSTFPEPLTELKTLKVLTLKRNLIKKIPESIGNLINLERIWLSENQLNTLPNSIGNLESLQELHLGWNDNFSSFPDSIGNLKSIKLIEVQSGQLSALPESIGKLTSLERLNLYENKLKNIPASIGNLKSLQELAMGRNQLNNLPDSIGNLSSLKELRLYTNKLSSIPDSIGKLKALEILSVGGNKLTTLPNSIANLISLKKLEVPGNIISTLPDSIGKLKSIDQLELSSNKLKTLPETIGDLISVRILKLDNNNLESLPDSFWKLNNIKSVWLAENNWKNEWKGIDNLSTDAVLEFSQGNAPISLYISYSEDDEKNYKIGNLIYTLKSYKEILEVHHNQKEKIAESQILMLIGSQNFKASKIFIQDISEAIKHDIEIIPIKGMDIEWQDFNQIDLKEEGLGTFDLSNKKGFELNAKNLKQFCNDLYEYIQQYKRKINLFEPEERKLYTQIQNIKRVVEKLIVSEDFETNLKTNLSQLVSLYSDLKNKKISQFDYLLKYIQLLS